jgi:hypothetical protein
MLAIATLLTEWLANPTAPTVRGASSSTSAVQPRVAAPPAGTLTPCAVIDGRDHYECFVQSRGNTTYLLDFYSHNHVVVMWGLKPDDDTYAWSQRWQFWWQPEAEAFLIYNEHSDRCLAVEEQGQVGAPMNVAPCVSNDRNQLWHWRDDTSRMLQNQYGTCLDVPGGEYEYGTNPVAYDCNGGLNQQWALRPA